MKKILYITAIVLMAVACRPTGDELLSYGQNDYQAFYDANHSYAGEFKALWTALNENYCIWDYEAEYGLDWDQVYATYLPKFEELDKRQEDVTDLELSLLYSGFLNKLHDGHLQIQVKNPATGKYLTFSPNMQRIINERWEQYKTDRDNITTLDVYQTSAVEDKYRIRDYAIASSTTVMASLMDSICTQLINGIDNYVAVVDSLGGPNETNNEIYADLLTLREKATKILEKLNVSQTELDNSISSIASTYNTLCTQYKMIAKQVGVEMKSVEKNLSNDGLGALQVAVFEGNIVYMRLNSFYLTSSLEPSYVSSDTASMYYAYQMSVQRTWRHWFDTIQALDADGTLGGVIFDVRNNGGGYVNDYKFVLGALLPAGGWESHTMRVKNGSGRLDFGPLVPFVVKTYPGEHAVIDQRPIVVLANTCSVSMAENTTWGVKSQPNGCFIGTRTYGGLSALNTAATDYSSVYSGAFGVQGTTPIYGYVPKYVCLYPQADGSLRPAESHGFDPDIEVPLDVNLWKSAQRDNQLEKAIDYIRSK